MAKNNKCATSLKNASHVPASGANSSQNTTHFGDGIADAAKRLANQRMQNLANTVIDTFFDSIEEKVKEIPDVLKKLRNNSEIKKELVTIWAQKFHDYDNIIKNDTTLPDTLLIENSHQEGYFDGLYVGHLLTMAAMIQHGIPWQDCQIIEKLITFDHRYYEERKELIQQLKNDIDEYTKQSSDNQDI